MSDYEFSEEEDNFSDTEKIKGGNTLNKKNIDVIFDSDDDDEVDDNEEEIDKASDEETDKIINDDDDDYYDEQIGGGDSDLESNDDDDDVDDENEDEPVNLKLSTKSKKKEKITIDPNLDDYDDDDDDDDDENYLQKFDKEISKNYIVESHPECIIHNYDEISKLTIVVRDNDGIIVDPLHKTIPFLTKYEKTRILGQRTKQIEEGAVPFIKVPENIIEAHIIAELEMQQKRIPFIIRRPIPGGGCEYWNLKDLEMVLF
jgi:DNA-directed RNA polymerase I, II, and III subunit RPABC2